MSLTTKEYEELYQEIVNLYDLAENVIDAIELNNVESPEEQLKIGSSVVEQVQESADVITETYIEFTKSGSPTAQQIKKIETALRKIFMAIITFTEELKKLPAQTKGRIKDVHRQFVEKLEKERQVIASVLHKLVQNIEKMKDGPHRTELVKQQERLTDWSALIASVVSIGDHTLAMCRAFANPEIGLVHDIQLAEPGARLTGKGLVGKGPQHSMGY